MLDLRNDLESLLRSLARLTSAHRARSVMFIAARGGEGTSSIAASVALMVADRAPRATWLVDLDLLRNGAFAGFDAGFARGLGRPGRALDASLQADQFYVVPGAEAEPSLRKLLTVHNIDGSRLLVTRFRGERLGEGRKVQLRTAQGWWDALKAMSDWIIVDAPALAQSNAGLVMASQMDGVVLVVQADVTSAEDLSALRLEIESHGGKVIGVVMNRLRADARVADRFEAAN